MFRKLGEDLEEGVESAIVAAAEGMRLRDVVMDKEHAAGELE